MSNKPPRKTPSQRTNKMQKRPIPRTLRDPYDPAAVRCFVPGEWPKIGGPGDVSPMRAWDDEAVRERYKPHIRVAVRVFACDGQSALARDLQMPIFKISTTRDISERCDTRVAQLNRDRYASTFLEGEAWKAEEGWAQWMIVPIPVIASLSPHSPVTVHERGLDVLLPQELSPELFDKRLTEELGGARLDLWLDTEPGRTHLAALGLNSTRFKRFTSYNVGRQHPRRSRATELVIFKPRLHAGRLVGLIERVVHDAVMATALCKHAA